MPDIRLPCIPDDQAARDRISAIVKQKCVPYQGSVPAFCSVCGCKVWVGPKQQEHLADATIYCFECVAREAPGAIIQLSDKQWGE